MDERVDIPVPACDRKGRAVEARPEVLRVVPSGSACGVDGRVDAVMASGGVTRTGGRPWRWFFHGQAFEPAPQANPGGVWARRDGTPLWGGSGDPVRREKLRREGTRRPYPKPTLVVR